MRAITLNSEDLSKIIEFAATVLTDDKGEHDAQTVYVALMQAAAIIGAMNRQDKAEALRIAAHAYDSANRAINEGEHHDA